METNRSQSNLLAFSLIEVLVIIAVLALLAGSLLPPLAEPKSKKARIHCINNLRQDGLAFRMWSDDHNAYPMRYQTNNFDGPAYGIQQQIYIYYQAMSNELSTPKILVCPSDDRSPALNFNVLSNTNISYFVGMDADETMPQMFLAGDRNLTNNGASARNGVAMIRTTNTIGWNASMHNCQGGVLLVDGSVQGFTSSGVQRAASQTGTNIMRLSIP